jgi:hypothetical protein
MSDFSSDGMSDTNSEDEDLRPAVCFVSRGKVAMGTVEIKRGDQGENNPAKRLDKTRVIPLESLDKKEGM